ncbi:hypothetical protein D3C74_137710 [compost metagenome]
MKLSDVKVKVDTTELDEAIAKAHQHLELMERADLLDDEEYLFTIKVKDMDSVPAITYKGNEIKGLIDITYDWRTKSFFDEGEHRLAVEHASKDRSVTSINIDHCISK